MSRVRENQMLLPSVLDRLIDDEPENTRETPRSRNQVLRELRQSVRRDLEDLLNTRWRCTAWPPNLDELEVSLVNYGIPDFTGAVMNAPEDRDSFRRVIEQTIRRFEPRFKTVKVELLKNSDRTDRTMRFRIDALMHAEPAPEPVVFDSHMEPTTRTFEVKGANR